MSDVLRELQGAGDTAWTIGKSALKQPVAGYAGLLDILRGKGLGSAVGTIEDVGAVEPSTPEGARNLQAIGGAVESVGNALGNPVDKIGEYSPLLGAGAAGFVETVDPTKVGGKAARAAKAAAKASEKAAKAAKVVDTAVQAPKAVDVARMFKGGEQAGTYRGTAAFGGITPQKLGSMRADYLRSMEEGASGRDWYDRASATNFKLAGEDVGRAEKLADIEAITSARTPVGANLMYSAKGTNQALVGDPVRTGGFPTDMGKRIEDTWAKESGGEGLGLKRSPYRAGLAVDWQGPESVKRATHDIHDVRAWGIKDPQTGKPWSKGVPDAGHRFLDEQAQWAMDTANARKLGDFDDWKLHNAQAAAWIAQKAKAKGMSVADAARDYTDFVPDYSAQITREWTPGATANHLPEILRADEGLRRDYAGRMESAVKGPQGIDKIASDMGMLTDTTLPNRGLYEGQTNPGFASQVLVGKEGGGLNMDPASKRAAEAVAAAHGLIGVQDQSALNYLGGAAPAKRAGAFQIATGRPMSDVGLANVSRIAQQHGGDVAQVDPRGARVLSFHDEADPKRKALIDALRAEYPHADVTPMARDSSLFPLKEGSYWEKPEKWSSKPYIEKIEAGGPQMVEGFNKSMQTVAPQLLRHTEEIAAQHGFTQAPWFKPMMESLSTGGLASLKDLVAKGVVPVAAMTAIMQGMQPEEQMQ
jgi:hypothetical protein